MCEGRDCENSGGNYRPPNYKNRDASSSSVVCKHHTVEMNSHANLHLLEEIFGVIALNEWEECLDVQGPAPAEEHPNDKQDVREQPTAENDPK